MPTVILPSRVTRSGKAYGATVIGQPGRRSLHPNSTFDISTLLQRALELDSPHLEDFNYVQEASAPASEHLEINPPLANGGQPKKHKKDRFRAYRREKRNQEAAAGNAKDAKDSVAGRLSLAINIPIDVDELPATSCGYRASQSNSGRREVHDLEHYRTTRGFTYLPWDGIEPLPLVDPSTGRVCSVLLGQPNDSSYLASTDRVYRCMEHERKTNSFKPCESIHPRGDFVAINDGVYHGQGSKAPHRLNTGPHEAMLKRLRENKDMMRLASFASAGLAKWAPRLHVYYKTRMDALLKHLPDLKPNFSKSVFACAAYNFGPIVCCFPHRDCTNCPFGFCAVTALGEYDHTKGGHLILEELGLIVEFPSGSTVLIPSAVITHCNTPVEAHERRLSFTQFMPGEVLRFVDNGFRNEVDIRAADSKEYEELCKKKETRWEEGMAMWSTLESLFGDAQQNLERKAKRKQKARVEIQDQVGVDERRRGKKRMRAEKEGEGFEM